MAETIRLVTKSVNSRPAEIYLNMFARRFAYAQAQIGRAASKSAAHVDTGRLHNSIRVMSPSYTGGSDHDDALGSNLEDQSMSEAVVEVRQGVWGTSWGSHVNYAIYEILRGGRHDWMMPGVYAVQSSVDVATAAARSTSDLG